MCPPCLRENRQPGPLYSLCAVSTITKLNSQFLTLVLYTCHITPHWGWATGSGHSEFDFDFDFFLHPPAYFSADSGFGTPLPSWTSAVTSCSTVSFRLGMTAVALPALCILRHLALAALPRCLLGPRRSLDSKFLHQIERNAGAVSVPVCPL